MYAGYIFYSFDGRTWHEWRSNIHGAALFERETAAHAWIDAKLAEIAQAGGTARRGGIDKLR